MPICTEGNGLVGGMGEYEGAWRMACVRGLIGDIEPAGKQCVECLPCRTRPRGTRRTRNVVAIHKDDFTEVVREDPGGKDPPYRCATRRHAARWCRMSFSDPVGLCQFLPRLLSS
jgi:hypothetical protein